MPTIDYKDIGEVLSYETLRGTIISLDPATDTCVVSVNGTIVSALVFYHCSADGSLRSNGAVLGGAAGFSEGDEVLVLRKFDWSKVYVIGHVGGIKRCSDGAVKDYYIFYIDGTTLRVANCNYDTGITVRDTKSYDQIYTQNFTNPVVFHLKKFYHRANGVLRTLYFIATSLYINSNPFLGWVNFAAANPTFALVTNNSNSVIPITSQVIADLTNVNTDVNNSHTYVSDPLGNDNWKLLGVGVSGDCEDFALTKAEALLALGYPASAIHIEAGQIDGSVRGHAWLVVQTSGGDYALDTSSNSILLNSDLKPTPTTEYTGRRRQIGSKWAFISPFGWMLSSQNVAMPSVCYYILDPSLNIFYELFPGMTNNLPFSYVRTSGSDLSGPSINFSTDNTAIYVADGLGEITVFRLNENSLDVMDQYAYTSGGFVGRNGLILEPLGVFGRQDPYALVDGIDWMETYEESVYYLYAIQPQLRGTFRALNEIITISGDGYYEYDYRYVEGEFVYDGFENPQTSIIDIHDVEYPDNQKFYKKSIVHYDYYGQCDEIIRNDELIYAVKQTSLALINKTNNPVFLDHTLIKPFIYNHSFFDPLQYIIPSGYGFDPETDAIGLLNIPYGNEQINIYGANYFPSHGPYVPYMWNHLEVGSDFFQGLLINRPVSAGDNLKRMYKNGISCLSEVISAVSTTETNLLGLVCIPSTNRLS